MLKLSEETKGKYIPNDLCITYKDQSIAFKQFIYTHFDWYKDNNILYSFDYDMFVKCIDDETCKTYRCPQKYLAKILHILKVHKASFKFCVYGDFGIVVFIDKHFKIHKRQMQSFYKWFFSKNNLDIYFVEIKNKE